MDANELANELDKCYFYEGVISKSADMLRKQAAEIKALKEALEVKVILNEHAQQSMQQVKDLLKSNNFSTK